MEYYKKLNNFIQKIRFKNRIVQNVNLDLTSKNQKRALISYIVRPLEISVNNIQFHNHTQNQELIQIIKSFIDLNFVIDILENLLRL